MTERRADPAMYARVFEENREGQLVLEDLVNRFGGRLYVRGGQEAERETLVRLGKRAVLDHIVAQVNHARGAEPPEDDDSNSQPAG